MGAGGDTVTEPVDLGEGCGGFGEGDEGMAGASGGEVGHAAFGEVGHAGEEGAVRVADAALDEAVLVEGGNADGDVGFVADEAEDAVGGDEFDGDRGVFAAEGCEGGGEEVLADPFEGGEADDAFEAGVAGGDAAFGGEHGLFHLLGHAEEGGAEGVEHHAADGAFEEWCADAGFELFEPSAHGWLGDAEHAGGGGEAAVARDGEDEAEVVPVEHGSYIKVYPPNESCGCCMGGALAMCSWCSRGHLKPGPPEDGPFGQETIP